MESNLRQALQIRQYISAMGELSDLLAGENDGIRNDNEHGNKITAVCRDFIAWALQSRDIAGIVMVGALSKPAGAGILISLSEEIPELIEPALGAAILMGNREMAEAFLGLPAPARDWSGGAFMVSYSETETHGESLIKPIDSEVNSTGWCCTLGPSRGTCIVSARAHKILEDMVSRMTSLGICSEAP